MNLATWPLLLSMVKIRPQEYIVSCFDIQCVYVAMLKAFPCPGSHVWVTDYPLFIDHLAHQFDLCRKEKGKLVRVPLVKTDFPESTTILENLN